MDGAREQIKGELKRELGVFGIEILQEFLDSKKEKLSESHIEELEDHLFEKIKKERGFEKAEEVVDRIKKIRLLKELEGLREKSKSKIQYRSRYEVLKELGDVCLNLNQLSEAENYFEEMLEISEEFDRKEMILESLKLEAELYLIQDELSKVEENARRIIDLSRKSSDRILEGEGIKLAGIVAWRKGDNEEGKNYLNDALEIFEEKGLKEDTAAIYRELGDLHVSVENYERGVEYYEKAADLFGEAEMFYERANMLLEIGVILSERGNEEALEYLKLVEQESMENCFFDFAGWSSLNLAEIYFEENSNQDAEEKARKALDLFKRVGDKHGEGGANLTLGRIIGVEGDLSEAERFLGEALNTFRRLELSESEAETLYRLAEVQKEMKKFDRAKTNLEEALKISDSLDMTEMKEKIEGELANLTK